MGRPRKDFWSQVDKLEPDMCWPWLGYVDHGVPKFGNALAHRYAYELVHGTVGRRHLIQTCGQRTCCNPSHIKLAVPTRELDPNEPSPEDATIASFWSRVDVGPDHWMWKGVISKRGHALFRHHSAAAFSYRLFVGPIHRGHLVHRCCEVRGCVSPWHLQSRPTHGQRACPQGHRFTKKNTRINKAGYKVCRECVRQYARRSRRGVASKQESM